LIAPEKFFFFFFSYNYYLTSTYEDLQ